LRDSGKLLLILYQVNDDSTLIGDQTSGSEDEDLCDEISASSEEECSNQENEKSHSRDSKAQVAAETAAAEMVANIISLLVIKK
jgi:hypothetical protein